MGTIADKLSYLNTTKGKIKDSINLTGANIGNNDTFRSYSAKLRDSLVDIINNGTDELYDNFPKVTGTGSEIELNNTYEAPMGIDLKGNTSQESYSGKNLCNFNFNVNNVGIQANMSGSEVILNGTTTGNGIIYLNSNNNITLPAGTYTISSKILNGAFNAGSKDTALYIRKKSDNTIVIELYKGNQYTKTNVITLSEETTFYFHIYTNGSDFVFDNLKLGIQIESGSTATDYEPYVGGTPSPNPNYPQNIEVVTGYNEVEVKGKNLFDKDSVILGKVWNGATNAKRAYGYIVAEQGKTYTISTQNTNNDLKISVVEITTIEEGGSPISQNNVITSFTFTPNASTNYIAVQFSNANNDVTQEMVNNALIQIEISSTATTYEAYQGATYPINLGKNLFDKNNLNKINASIDISTNKLYQNNNYRLLYIPCKSNTTYTISKISSNYLDVGYTKTTPAFDVDVYGYITSSSPHKNITITTGSDAKYLFVRYYKTDDTLTEQEILDTIQIEEGTQATSYSPYKTPIEFCEIGDYQDEFRETTGKNLFDKNNANVINAYCEPDSIKVLNVARAIYIPITGGKTYTISKNGSARLRAATTEEIPANNVEITDYVVADGSSTTNVTITTSNNTKYLFVYFYLTSDSNTKTLDEILSIMQIEEGSTATEYEPYGKVWYLHKEIGKIVLDGSENGWNRSSILTNTTAYNLDSNIGYKATSGNSNDALLNYFKGNSNGYSVDEQCFWFNSSGYLRIRINKTIASTIEELKTWLSTHNTEVYYILNTPTNTEITDEELISQLNTIKNAMSKKDKTYITAKYVEGNQSFKIVASALLKEE